MNHVPEIAPRQGGWGVFCSACSEEEGNYVYPCQLPRGLLDEPPAVLVDPAMTAARLLDRAESYQRDAGVIRQALGHDEAVAYETIAAELRRVAEEVGR